MNALETIRGRFEELLWGGRFSENSTRMQKNAPGGEELYADLRPGDVAGTWCWEDIDYTDQTRSGWQAANHYVRMLKILKDFGRDRLLQDAAYSEKMTGALRYWLCHDFTNPNWWHNDIGMPRNMADLTLMLRPVLSPADYARATELVGRGSMATREDISAKWTGANLIWGAMNTLKHALLTEDEGWVRRAVERAAVEVCNDRAEGIQPDGSFFQHGPRLYSGGYGRSFAYDIAQLVFVLQQTPYQLSREKLDIFLTHILDGLRYMTQGDALDWACIGREISRVDATRVGLVKGAVELLVNTGDVPRREELRAYLNTMNGGEPMTGTKYFPAAALLCHHTGGVYVGAKFHNNRLWDAEICNGEGELCYNMSYGTHTCIMRDGGEYNNINPVWDYSRVPGTTSRTENDAQLLAHRDWWCLPLPSSHAGGGQQGDRGIVYEIAEHDGIEVFAADFAFEGGFVCLGAGVRTVRDSNEMLVTTVDQCLRRGDVTLEGESIIHNGIRYTPLMDTKLHQETKVQSGSWQRNNFAESAAEVSAEVLTLTILHEANKLGEYAYMISPADRPAPAVQVLRNDCGVQAIRLADGGVMAAFHQPCRLVFKDRIIAGEPGAYFDPAL